MATNLIRHLPRAGLIRHNNLGSKYQTRSSSTSAGPQIASTPPTSSLPQRPIETLEATGTGSSSSLKLAVGVSLGLSIGLLVQDSVIKRLFPDPEPKQPEKVAPAVDPILIEQLISQDRKVNQLENQLSQLKQDIRERNQQEAKQIATVNETANRNSGNVFELAQVLDANNLANSQRYERLLEEQRKALVREHLLKVEGEILKVENKYRPIINKIRELENHLESQRELQAKEAPARLLWLACQSFLVKLRDSALGPLEKDPEYEILKGFVARDNSMAIVLLDSIPEKALRDGVQSEYKLQERFNKIEHICKRVALIDAHGGGLGKYLLSYIQSLFILDRPNVCEDEVLGRKLVDPSEWTTFDILARVKYCLKENNLEQAIRYANQLKGQARVVARDWIRDARVHLTTRQAFKSLSTHAEALAVNATLGDRNASQQSNKV